MIFKIPSLSTDINLKALVLYKTKLSTCDNDFYLSLLYK